MIGPGEILAGLNILDKLGKFYDRLRAKKSSPIESIATRFIRLFESHGVHRNQIPRFIGHGLTLRDVQDDASLLEKLDEALLEATCAKFAVRREWLDGAEPQIHPCHDFYKDPKGFSDFLGKLLASNPEGQLDGILLSPKESAGKAEALIILQEIIGAVGDKPIYRHHLLNNWMPAYWKSRAYLTACIAIAWKRGVYIYGFTLPGKEIEKLAYGSTLLGWGGEGVWALRHRKWYPEDMALEPEAFLKGIDPERDNFGISAALRLWLDLEQQGLMNTGLNDNQARQKFQNELAKYTSAVTDGVAHTPLSKE